jgi:hypothetical protein
MKAKSNIDKRNRILLGLEKSYAKMLDFKKQKKSEVVVLRGGKIIKLKPE